MLTRVTAAALQRPLLTVIAMLGLIAGGIFSFLHLPIDAFPDVSAPQVKIIVKVPGMTPEEIESRVTVPVETELLGMPAQTMLRSTSKYGLTDITLDFAEGTDIFWARNQVSERLGGIWSSLPADAAGGLAPITTPLGEMFMFTVEGPLPLAERRALLDWVIRPALRTVPGVADVNVLGGLAGAYEVAPDPVRMAAAAVDLSTLRQALTSNNSNSGAGRIADGEETLLVRVQGRLDSLEDIANVVVREQDGRQIRVRDVAEVRSGALTRLGGVTRDGRGEAVQGLVLGLRGANARDVVNGIKTRLQDLQSSLPAGIRVVTVYDRSALVDRAVRTVAKALAEAVALVVVLLVLFLGHLRAALTVAVVLPLSALWTFLLMRWAGVSANLMSLGGLAIAIGMLVDAAVVVVENIVARLQAHPEDELPARKTAMIIDAIGEVAVPVGAGMLIIGLVFLPLLTLEGLEGKLFAPVALTILFALAGSLLLSLTVIPLLAQWLLHPERGEEPWLPRTLAARYVPLLERTLARPQPLLAGAGVLLLASLVAYTQLGKTFMPSLDEGDMIVQLEKLPSISLDSSLATDTRFQQALLARVPDIAHVTARTGTDEIGLDPMGLNQTDSFITLKPERDWTLPDKTAIQDAIREVLSDFPGISYAFTQPIEMRVSEMIIGVRGDVAIRLFGPDLDVLNREAERIASVLRRIRGAEDVYYVENEGVQYLQVRTDREALARAGLSVDSFADLLRAQIEGERVGLIQQTGRRIPLLLRGDDQTRTAESLAQMLITLPSGERAALGRFARFERVGGPVQVSRQQGQRYQVVIANVRDRDLVGFVQEAQAAVAREVPLATGYSLTWGGQFENQQRASQRLAIVVPVALVLIFLILYTTFRSLRQATLVLANIPLALVGGIFALTVSGEYLSVPASVGFIALLGIAVLNGVVLISCFNQLRDSGMPVEQVVREGALRRLRPVMLTASMTALALVPLLFATGPGSEVQRPLAIVVIGGLLSSTVLTLFLLPVLYRRFGVEQRPDGGDMEGGAPDRT